MSLLLVYQKLISTQDMPQYSPKFSQEARGLGGFRRYIFVLYALFFQVIGFHGCVFGIFGRAFLRQSRFVIRIVEFSHELPFL